MAKVNLIDYAELCDMAFFAMLKYDKTYVKTGSGDVYVPAPGPDVRKAFTRCLDACVKQKFSPFDGNFIVRSCRPCDNWRLKHVGGRYRNMVEPRRLVPVRSKVPVELAAGWESFLDSCWESFRFARFDVEGVDFDDVYDVIALTESVISMKYASPKVVMDANRLIDRSAKMLRSVAAAVVRTLTEVRSV